MDAKIFPSFSIRDAKKAKDFYENVLGVHTREVPMGECSFLELDLGESKAMLYEKPDHVPATYTVLNFEVKDISSVVRDLSRKGVKFERYEGTDQLGITHNEGPLIAWFKDPDGNFLSIMQDEHTRTEYSGEAPPSPS